MVKPDIRFCDLPIGRHFEFSNSETFSSICKKTSPLCYTWQDGDGQELNSRVTNPLHVWVRPMPTPLGPGVKNPTFSHFNVCFADVWVGERFLYNGNVWCKRSSRTATGISEGLPKLAYFRVNDMCKPAIGLTP